ncbi:hypothetical protein WJX81_004296 [Elliptochloris bilobata]|uniref:Photolyase/cryptochrome alpha/beta domain-containing protein n=1 Tax=Elliptochloris bilobata TaxID=381761 RepID=A0AAW1SCF2_9CHLO
MKDSANLYRQGDLSAEALQEDFARALPDSPAAPALFADLAALLPPGPQRAGLRAAAVNAGWTLNPSFSPNPVSASAGAGRGALRGRALATNAGGGWSGGASDAGADPEGAPALVEALDSAWAPLDRSRITARADELAGGPKAARTGGVVAFVFVSSPEEDGDDLHSGMSWRPAGASLYWLQEALRSFDADLRSKIGAGAGVLYRRGPYLPALQQAAAALGAGAVYMGRRCEPAIFATDARMAAGLYEPAMIATDARVAAGLEAGGLAVRSFNTLMLHEPGAVRLDMSRYNGHFGTLMPFVRACDRLPAPPKPLPVPLRVPVAASAPEGLSLDELGLAPMPLRADGTAVDWAAGIRGAWDISEAGALRQMDVFLDAGFPRYEAARQFADARAVSRLSPYLHFGQLSARVLAAESRRRGGPAVSKTFSRRLAWRDLASWQLLHWPRMPAKPIRSPYARQAWRDEPGELRAWQRGRTGFPLVDAGMRELWATGWMQQSVRMVCAAFLVEYLSLHWVHGCRWFHYTLVDADLAINSMMWQNAGKSGLDQWNFTLLPTSSSQDPDGAYVARWVPELAQLPRKWIHSPWAAPAETLAAAGVELGGTYPHRLTKADLKALRQANAEAINAARRTAPHLVDRNGYDMIEIPKGATAGEDGKIMRIFTKPEYRKLWAA